MSRRSFRRGGKRVIGMNVKVVYIKLRPFPCLVLCSVVLPGNIGHRVHMNTMCQLLPAEFSPIIITVASQ